MYEKGHEDDEETVDKSPADPCACYGSRIFGAFSYWNAVDKVESCGSISWNE